MNVAVSAQGGVGYWGRVCVGRARGDAKFTTLQSQGFTCKILTLENTMTRSRSLNGNVAMKGIEHLSKLMLLEVICLFILY